MYIYIAYDKVICNVDKHLREFNKIDNIEGLNLERSLILSVVKKRYHEMVENTMTI